MILSKPGESDLTQVAVEVAEGLRKEVWIAVLKHGETAKDKQSLRTIWCMRPQCDVVGSSTELYEVMMELESNGVGKLAMCLEAPVVSCVWSAEQSRTRNENAWHRVMSCPLYGPPLRQLEA